MARKKRIWYPGAIYHVMSRGNRRVAIFNDYTDYLRFLINVQKIKKEIPFRIHSLCLMTNHFHLSIETEKIPLSKIMQRILSIYAEAYNHVHDYTGHLFEGRYTAQIIEDEQYFLEVSRYIHLNPVKACMVKDPSDYEYSSYRCFLNDGVFSRGNKVFVLIDELVDTSRILQCFDGNSCRQYRDFVEDRQSHGEHELLIQKDMHENELWLPKGVRPFGPEVQ